MTSMGSPMGRKSPSTVFFAHRRSIESSMGPRREMFQSVRLGPHTMHIPEPDTENDSCLIVSEPVHVTFANDRLS